MRQTPSNGLIMIVLTKFVILERTDHKTDESVSVLSCKQKDKLMGLLSNFIQRENRYKNLHHDAIFTCECGSFEMLDISLLTQYFMIK